MNDTKISLHHVEQFILEGRFNEANQLIKHFKKKKDILLEHQLNFYLFESQIKIELNDFEEGIKLAKKVLEKGQEPNVLLLKIDACITIAKAYEGLKKFDESLEVIENGNHILEKAKILSETIRNQKKASLLLLKGRSLKAKNDLDQAILLFQDSLALRKKIGNKEQIAESLTNIGQILSIQGIKNEALKHFKRSLTLLKHVGNEKELAQGFWNVGSIYCHLGNTDKALENFSLSRNHFEKTGDYEGIGQALYCLGAMSHDKGDLKDALEYQQRSLDVYEKIGNKTAIAKTLTKIGFIYISKGELDRALEYHQRSLTIYDEIGKNQKSWTLIGIEIYQLRGELDLALSYLEQSLDIRKEFDQKEDIAECLFYIGKIFHQQGKLDTAWECLEESLGFLDESQDRVFMTAILLELVSLAVDKRNPELSNQYMKSLKSINNQEKNLIIYQRYRMARALYLKNSNRIRDKALVQEIFQQITESEIVDHRITVTAIYNLCESLLDELKAYGESSVILEVKSLANKLTELADLQSSYRLTIDALILKAKLALVEGNLDDAKELLKRAKKVTEEKNLGLHIVAKVSTERKHLDEEYSIWQRLIKDESTFKERLEQAELKTYLTEALKLARIGKDHKDCE